MHTSTPSNRQRQRLHDTTSVPSRRIVHCDDSVPPPPFAAPESLTGTILCHHLPPQPQNHPLRRIWATTTFPSARMVNGNDSMPPPPFPVAGSSTATILCHHHPLQPEN